MQKRKKLFYFHSITGLVTGIFILLMSLSGSVLVFEDEINSSSVPAFAPVPSQPLLSADSAFNIVHKKFPLAQVSNCRLPQTEKEPWQFSINDITAANKTTALTLYLHPQTGGLLNVKPAKGFRNNPMSWLAGFHQSFQLGKTGEWLLGFLGIVFLVNLLTGLYLFRKKIAAVIFFKKQVYHWKNLHQLVGVYALIFNLLIAVTGTWMQRYVFKADFYHASSWKPVWKPTPALNYNFAKACTNLKKIYPAFTGRLVYFPQATGGSTIIYGSRNTNSFIHSKKMADYISLDSTGNIAHTGFVTDIDPADRYDIINAQLHFGGYGGLTVKIIYSLLGLTGGILSITGFLLYLERKKRDKSPAPNQNAKNIIS